MLTSVNINFVPVGQLRSSNDQPQRLQIRDAIDKPMPFPHASSVARVNGKKLVYDVEVIIINKGEEASFEEDLAQDVLEIITVFSARLYGSRSKKNQKLINGMKKAVDNTQAS